MKKNHKHYIKSFSQFIQPLTSEIRYYKNFKLSQQHHGIKGLKK